MEADARYTVHLTDLGSVIAPESERQAPYSSVGQVRVSWPSSITAYKLLMIHSLSILIQATSSHCIRLVKLIAAGKANLRRWRQLIMNLSRRDPISFDFCRRLLGSLIGSDLSLEIHFQHS